MINISDKVKCCGCGACSQKCPKSCITMIEDYEGFLYPKVDQQRCIECSLCEIVCPCLNPHHQQLPLQNVGFVAKDEKVHQISSSGGAFISMAKVVLANRGVVFGAAFNEDFRSVSIISIDNEIDLLKLVGSKYIQAVVGDSYVRAQSFLKQGRQVLYSGTPCQIAGLKSFLKIDYENLVAVDCMCHAVPSPKVWRKYLDKISNGKKIDFVTFRNKKLFGWNNYSLIVRSESRDIYASGNRQDTYMRGFLAQLTTRPSCYNCCAQSFKSASDIMIGDFWNVEKYHHDKPEYMRDDGVSLLLLNTSKGVKFFNYIRQYGYNVAASIEEVEIDKSHSCLVQPSKPHPLRGIYFKLFQFLPVDTSILFCLNIIRTLQRIKHIIIK